MIVGLASAAVGGIGILVPGLPTTVFFIIAAWAFAKSSPRLEAWVLGLPGIGPAVSDYRSGLGMPKRAKIAAIIMLVTAVTISSILVGLWWLRFVIVGAGAIGVGFILRTPTKASP